MSDKISNTTVPLEWDNNISAWPFPLLNHNGCEFKGLLFRKEGRFSQLPKNTYHLQKAHNGEHRILWTDTTNERPDKIYGLAAIKPKSTNTFFGIPTPVATAIIAALAAGLGTGWITNLTNSDSLQLKKQKTRIEDLQSQLRKKEEQNNSLYPYKKAQDTEHELVIKLPLSERVLYLFGKSHGLRIDAIRRQHRGNPVVSDIAIQAETNYVITVLAENSHDNSFTSGKKSGQDEATRLLGLEELKTLKASDLTK